MTSDPSNPEPPEVLPQSLRTRLGISRRQRCLSSRDAREVWLVEDAVGARRVFKIHRDRDTESLARFQQVREVLKGLPAGTGLLSVTDYGLEPVHGLAWEELPVADALDPDVAGFDEYSPATLASLGSASAQAAAKAVLEVVRGLEFLHRRGWVHGDVKPANVLRWKGEWVLGDYDTLGLGREAGLTITASTEGYCPPGICEGPDRDFFALGKLIYELSSGNSRLEYPSIPSRLTDAGTWSREDRLINRLIEALCHPVGLNRLHRLETVRQTLEALASATDARMSRAEALLQPRSRRPLKVLAALAAVATLAWLLILNSGWLPALP
ncbi:MAG: protein kinase domain-containing protein, partial [Verrucomicrobiota bacterium]